MLLVEDNEMNKLLVREILTLNGYDIVEAGTGAEGLRMLATEHPDIVLMDLHLPEMDGITATRIIKADDRNKRVPVLALTASAIKSEEREIVDKGGFDGYIAKPIEVKEFIRAINESVEKLHKA